MGAMTRQAISLYTQTNALRYATGYATLLLYWLRDEIFIRRMATTVRNCPGTLYEHPLVAPQVSHFMQVPFRTSVKFPHSPQLSPS